jgi:hypothetical protein
LQSELDRRDRNSVIVEGLGTGALAGISGKTEITAGHDKEHPFVLEYEMAKAEVSTQGF